MNIRYPLTLLYDGSCPLCAHEIGALRLRDRHGRLAFIDIADPAVGDTVLGVARADALTAMAAVDADGRILRAMDVFRASYEAVEIHWVARLTGLPLLKPLFDNAYPILARHRHRIPAWLSRHILFAGLPAGGCRGDTCAVPEASRKEHPGRAGVGMGAKAAENPSPPDR